MPRKNANAQPASSSRRKTQQPKQQPKQQRRRCEHTERQPWGNDQRYSYCRNCGKRLAAETVSPRARTRYTRTTRTRAPEDQQLALFLLSDSQEEQGEGTSHGE